MRLIGRRGKIWRMDDPVDHGFESLKDPWWPRLHVQ
jgi:hypothetical protein